jgi:ribose transport system substrate-binding protein
MKRSRRTSALIATALSLIAALALTACGSDGSSTSSTTESGGTTTTETGGDSTTASLSAPYKGVESGLPDSYPDPKAESGADCTIGYDQAIGLVGGLAAAEQAAKQQSEKLGCKFISLDAEGNLNKEVTNVNNLLVQGITALITFPLDPRALAPAYAKAQKAGIPIVSIGTPGVAGEPLGPYYETEVLQGFDVAAYYTAQNLAKEKPGAKFGVIGYAAPVPTLKYFTERLQFWGQHFGLTFLGQVDGAASATPSAAEAAANTLISKYPDMEAITVYNDQTALTVSSVARSSGRDLLITASNGENAAIEAVAAGQLVSTFSFQWNQLGTQAANAAYSLLTKQNLPLPKEILPVGELVTEENASEVEGVG